MVDVVVRPRDESRSSHDAQAYARSGAQGLFVRVFPRDASRASHDVQVRPMYRLEAPAVVAGGFPTQYGFLFVRKTGSTIGLCVVADADAPTGMGGRIRIQKGGVTYALYLVETSDGNASPVRVRTTAGTKSVRLKT